VSASGGSLRSWDERSREILTRYKSFEARRCVRVSPRTGAEHGFFVLGVPDWVNIVALTDDDRVILVRQYRHGTEAFELEVPGGAIDPEDPDPGHAAARELREETGYEAREIRPLGVMTPNPAFHTNVCHAYAALGCHRVGELLQDPGEDIEVVTVPRSEVRSMVQRGDITHALALAALLYARLEDLV